MLHLSPNTNGSLQDWDNLLVQAVFSSIFTEKQLVPVAILFFFSFLQSSTVSHSLFSVSLTQESPVDCRGIDGIEGKNSVFLFKIFQLGPKCSSPTPSRKRGGNSEDLLDSKLQPCYIPKANQTQINRQTLIHHINSLPLLPNLFSNNNSKCS